jgi:hypothetical protein
MVIKSLVVIIIGLVVVLRWWDAAWLFLKRKMMLRSFKDELRSFMESERRRPSTALEIFDSAFAARENDQGDDPERQVEAFHRRLMRALRNGRKPNKKEVRRLYELGKLRPVSERWLSQYPNAAYELKGMGDDIVFFCKDLSIAAVRDFCHDMEEILAKALERKHLLPPEADFFRYVDRLNEVGEWNKWHGLHYGGPGFPYPEWRYNIRQRIQGEETNFVFDENLKLIVAQKGTPTCNIVWERPGAQQPELYQ